MASYNFQILSARHCMSCRKLGKSRPRSSVSSASFRFNCASIFWAPNIEKSSSKVHLQKVHILGLKITIFGIPDPFPKSFLVPKTVKSYPDHPKIILFFMPCWRPHPDAALRVGSSVSPSALADRRGTWEPQRGSLSGRFLVL